MTDKIDPETRPEEHEIETLPPPPGLPTPVHHEDIEEHYRQPPNENMLYPTSLAPAYQTTSTVPQDYSVWQIFVASKFYLDWVF